MISLSDNKLQELYVEYQSTYPRPESVTTEFCNRAESLLEADGLKSENYDVQICRLHEYCGQKIEADLVVEAIDCSLSYARRFSYDDDRGGFEKEWSRSNQNQKVSPGTRTKIINRDGQSCLRCGAENEADLEVHHIVPISQGGKNKDSNLATLCSACHKAAHNGSLTSGETAYAEGQFQDWRQETSRNTEETDQSTDSNQKKIYDY